ncbi:unnamed protein product, partial [Didymodactylos carnosus]
MLLKNGVVRLSNILQILLIQTFRTMSSVKIETLTVKENKNEYFPNNDYLPVIVYRQVFGNDGKVSPTQWEELFKTNGFGHGWRWGIFNYHHYHSTAHEVLGCYSGHAKVRLGGEGEQGKTIELNTGDCVFIPAGVSHKNLNDETENKNFSVVGAYDLKGKKYDMNYGKKEEYDKAIENIKNLKIFLIMDEKQWQRLTDVGEECGKDKNPVVQSLKKRTTFVKYKSNGRSYSRIYFLTTSEDAVDYFGSKRNETERAYLIRDIEEVRIGFNTTVWKECLKKKVVNFKQDALAFSILYDNNRLSLDLLADTRELRDLWLTGLEFLIKRYRFHLRSYREITDTWMWELFDRADLHRSKQLNRSEIRRLLHILNIVLPNDDIDYYFNLANTKTETFHEITHLDREEFILFYKLITNRPELLKIICQYNGTDKKHKEIANYNILSKLPILTETILPEGQSSDFKQSRKKSPKKQRQENRNDKEINNFLTIEQLKDFLQNEQHMKTISIDDCSKLIKRFEPSIEGKQCEEMGIDGLRLMLLHDEFCIMNPHHANEVYHDMTRPLSDYFIATSHNTYISDSQVYGECTPETYVRALRSGCRSVEIDCYDGDNHKPIVYHGKTFTKPVEFEDILIAIKDNAFVYSPYPLFLNIENHCSYEQQEVLAVLLKIILKEYLLTEPINDLSVLPSPENLKYKILIRSRRSPKGKTIADPKINNSNDETSLTPKSSPKHCYHSISFKESKATEFIKYSSDSSDLIRLTERQIVRIYPSSYRQDSSNLHPVLFWLYGAQMVALNFQADDESMSLHYGFFRDNCACGYLLKPSILLPTADETETIKPTFDPKDRSFSKGKKLTIRIISGQHLPKEKSIEDKDIIDPFVRVYIYGLDCDCHDERTPLMLSHTYTVCLKCLLKLRPILLFSPTSVSIVRSFHCSSVLLTRSARHSQRYDKNESYEDFESTENIDESPVQEQFARLEKQKKLFSNRKEISDDFVDNFGISSNKQELNEEQQQDMDDTDRVIRPNIDPSTTSVLLFPGQGTQFVGMGKLVVDYPSVKEMFNIANSILGYDLYKKCTEGPKEDLDQTIYAQPAIYVTSLAAVQRLKSENQQAVENCVVTAGFSVGEITALTFGGCLSYEDGLRLIKARAEAMQTASNEVNSGMMSVFIGHETKLGLAMEAAREWCQKYMKIDEPVVQVANHLYGECKVLAGHKEALQFIAHNYKEFNIRRIKYLPVSGAFHTPLMQSAKLKLINVLDKINMKPPIIQVMSNISGKAHSK